MAALIAWENLIDNAVLTVKADTVVNADFPLANLQLRGLADRCVITSGTSGKATLYADLGAGHPGVSLIALLGIDTTGAEYYDLSMWVYSSVDDSVYTYRGAFALGARPSENVPMNLYTALASTITDRYLRIEIIPAPWSAPGFPFSLARLWFGPVLSMADGIDAGWSMTFRDTGSVDETAGSQWVATTGVRTRVMNVPVEAFLSTEIAWGISSTTHAALADDPPSFIRLMFEAGVTGEVIAIPRTLSQAWMHRAGVYGHVDRTWQIGHKSGPYFGSSFSVIEER